jgi:hypothetical protein
MVRLKIVYNNDCLDLINKLQDCCDIESFNEDVFKERSKAFKLKGGYGARKTPFAVVFNEEGPVKAFYSEDNSCTFENIINYL